MGNTEKDNLAEQVERRVTVHREAQLETHEAFNYYEQISNGLGYDFMRSLDAAI